MIDKAREKIDYQWTEAGSLRMEAVRKYSSLANILNLAMRHHQEYGGTALGEAIKELKSAHVTAEMEMEIVGSRERALKDCLMILESVERDERAVNTRAGTDPSGAADGD